MKVVRTFSMFFLVFFLCAACTPHKKATSANQKYTPLECEAVMSCLSRIYLAQDSYCTNHKSIAGLEIERLMSKNGCFIGQHFKIIRTYLGKPDVSRPQMIVYYILNQKQMNESREGTLPAAINFEINKDSIVTGVTISQAILTE